MRARTRDRAHSYKFLKRCKQILIDGPARMYAYTGVHLQGWNSVEVEEVDDWSALPAKQAVKMIYDCKSRSWINFTIGYRIEAKPFAKGGMRYYAQQPVISIQDDHQS